MLRGILHRRLPLSHSFLQLCLKTIGDGRILPIHRPSFGGFLTMMKTGNGLKLSIIQAIENRLNILGHHFIGHTMMLNLWLCVLNSFRYCWFLSPCLLFAEYPMLLEVIIHFWQWWFARTQKCLLQVAPILILNSHHCCNYYSLKPSELFLSLGSKWLLHFDFQTSSALAIPPGIGWFWKSPSPCHSFQTDRRFLCHDWRVNCWHAAGIGGVASPLLVSPTTPSLVCCWLLLLGDKTLASSLVEAGGITLELGDSTTCPALLDNLLAISDIKRSILASSLDSNDCSIDCSICSIIFNWRFVIVSPSLDNIYKPNS